MKKLLLSGILLFVYLVVSGSSVNAQLLISEVEADPGDQTNDSCQYFEVRGTPGATVAENTWVVAIESDPSFPGFLSLAVNIGGKVLGTNGTLVVHNVLLPPCGTRVFDAGTTVVPYSAPLVIGNNRLEVGSESFGILVTDVQLFPGMDVDPLDDGNMSFEPQWIDAVAFLVNPEENFAYPNDAPVIGTPYQDVPDAFVRFPGNNTPFSADAYYWGELAAVPVDSTEFIGPLSPSFPEGGQLTPGGINVGGPAVPAKAIVDFDGDGRTDPSIVRNDAGQLTWWSALSSNSSVSAAPFGAAGDTVIPADFDGDGKDDHAVWRDGTFYILQSSDLTVRTVVFGATGDDANVSGDFDGDGKADIAVFRSTGGQAYFYYIGSNNNPNSDATFVAFGTDGDVAVRGDFDGDGKQDPAVFRPSTGFWYILNSGDGSLTAAPFGLASDIKVSGDFDGDAKTDIAVFRDGVFYILQSSDGQVQYVNWGTTGDIPVVGDYDGDGTTDVAVWRDGVFYVLNSTTGSPAYYQWGIPGDAPSAASFNR